MTSQTPRFVENLAKAAAMLANRTDYIDSQVEDEVLALIHRAVAGNPFTTEQMILLAMMIQSDVSGAPGGLLTSLLERAERQH
jgi:hypothetical protein